MLRLKKLLQPNANTSWVFDLLFLLVPAIWLTPYIYSNILAESEEHEHSGPGFADGSSDWIGNVFGFAFMLFLIIVFAIALFRLVYRYRRAKQSR